MEAIVLAGGFGTRLRHIMKDVPKPMASIAGRPFLDYILDNLISHGFDRVIMATGYRQEIVENHYKSCYRSLEITYSPEDQPLGTGGAIKKSTALCREEDVFIFNGDTFFDAEFIKMRRLLQEKNADAVIAVKRMTNFERYGAVKIEGNKIIAFQEKKKRSDGLINAGVYLIRRDLLNNVSKLCFSIEKDFFQCGTADKNLYAFESDGYFIDIGVESDYFKANEDFLEGR